MANPSRPRKPSLPLTLKRSLEGAARIAILAVGSDLRADDAAGLLVGRRLEELSWPPKPKVEIFFGETAPENLTGVIRQYQPTHLIVLDAAQAGAKPGSINVTDLGHARSGAVYCTHNLPLTVMLGYLRNLTSCQTIILGIEPKSLEFGGSVSPIIERSARQLAQTVHSSITAAAMDDKPGRIRKPRAEARG